MTKSGIGQAGRVLISTAIVTLHSWTTGYLAAGRVFGPWTVNGPISTPDLPSIGQTAGMTQRTGGRFYFSSPAAVVLWHVRKGTEGVFDGALDSIAKALKARLPALEANSLVVYQLQASPIGDTSSFLMVIDPVDPAFSYDPMDILISALPKTEADAVLLQLSRTVVSVDVMPAPKRRVLFPPNGSLRHLP